MGTVLAAIELTPQLEKERQRLALITQRVREFF